MKPRLTQEELVNLIRQKKTYLWAYKTLYEIQISAKTRMLILREVYRHPNEGGITGRGRFVAMTKERAESFKVS